jgi:hypothetical protein
MICRLVAAVIMLIIMMVAILAELIASWVTKHSIRGGAPAGDGSSQGQAIGLASSAHTFCIVSSFVGPEYPRAALAEWHEVPIEETLDGGRVDFFYYDGLSQDAKKYYPVRADVRCWIDYENIWDKAKLHRILGELAPDTIARTIFCDEHTVLPQGVWMIRSNLGSVGSKSRAVDNQADFLRAYRDFTADNRGQHGKQRNKHNGKQGGKRDVIMASEYIIDPMLYEDRKFHMRCYAILAIYGHGDAAIPHAWMIKQGLMIPASAKYAANDWTNPGIHDSHGHDNPDLQYFPDQFDRPDLVTACADVLRRALRVTMPTAKNYPETGRIGYEVVGADIMFTADGTPRIIEINGAPAIGDNTQKSKQNIFDAVLATVVAAGFSDSLGGSIGNPNMVVELF